MPLDTDFNLPSRIKASSIHLAICCAIAAMAAALVFFLWYPWPYRVLSGGQELFVLVTGVDLVLGPLLTFVIFDSRKNRAHLRRDLSVIGMVQIAGLLYGMYTVFEARPVALVFEVDRFRVVSAAEVYSPELDKAADDYKRLPLTGPWLVGVRSFRDEAEKSDAMMLGINGVDLGQRPMFWTAYANVKAQAASKARPLEVLLGHDTSQRAEIQRALTEQELRQTGSRFVPLIARKNWVVLLRENGDIAGFVPGDGFF